MKIHRVMHLGMVAVPVLGCVVGSQIGAGARRAAAADPLAPPAEVVTLPPERPRLDPTQTAAVVYGRSMREQSRPESPFYVISSASSEAVIEQDRSKEPEKIAPPPQFHLTSILKGKSPFATINGRLRKVGDEVEGAWTVHQIDPEAGTVLISAPGRESVLVKLR